MPAVPIENSEMVIVVPFVRCPIVRRSWFVLQECASLRHPIRRNSAVKNVRSFAILKRMKAGTPDLATLGQRIRHFRSERGLTLDQLGDAVGVAGSQLSLIENGKREPRLVAARRARRRARRRASPTCSPARRRAGAPPSRSSSTARSRARSTRALGLPAIRPGQRHAPTRRSRRSSACTASSQRRAREAIATPEEARRANTELRERMRDRDNYLPEIEELAEEQVRAVRPHARARSRTAR